ncbi:MAG: phytanoyl-CoA dioxygenase family protein [Planctomycetes bacterium]|nr:phytanoyl-CoA dioxygenase family protein [Planctomycetota bacterium]
MLVTVPVSAAERASGSFSADKIDQAVAALTRWGLVVLADAVDPAHVAALRDSMLADLPRILARSDAPYNFTASNVQQSPSRDPELLFRDVLFNEQAIAVTSRMLTGVVNAFYSGNTALPSAARQPVHYDSGHLWSDHLAPANSLVINLPLVDMSSENGSTELWPGSHQVLPTWPVDGITIPSEALERRRFAYPPIQPTMRAGSLLIRDMRLWHAGMPNRTAEPRPMLAMVHHAGWLAQGEASAFPSATRDFFTHPVLRTHAVFRDGPIDPSATDHPYAFAASAQA